MTSLSWGFVGQVRETDLQVTQTVDLALVAVRVGGQRVVGGQALVGVLAPGLWVLTAAAFPGVSVRNVSPSANRDVLAGQRSK
ncbi:MAG: hypothetical protein JO281_17305 [Pseudonocardiales bacterium]|nr:hypothetical protein [Pseudonocardiales bacterium]